MNNINNKLQCSHSSAVGVCFNVWFPCHQQKLNIIENLKKYLFILFILFTFMPVEYTKKTVQFCCECA